MARKQQRQARPPPRQGGGFLRGLLLGLAVAAGVQLYHGGLPDWFDGPGDDGAAPASRVEPPKTNFDFYRDLPKAEVRIDDPAAPGGAPPGTSTPPKSEPAAPRPPATAGGSPPREPAAPSAPREPAATPPAPRRYRVQVGSFRERKEADRLHASLALGGFESSIRTKETASGTRHRVVLGPFRGREAAEAEKARLTARGIGSLIVAEGN